MSNKLTFITAFVAGYLDPEDFAQLVALNIHNPRALQLEIESIYLSIVERDIFPLIERHIHESDGVDVDSVVRVVDRVWRRRVARDRSN